VQRLQEHFQRLQTEITKAQQDLIQLQQAAEEDLEHSTLVLTRNNDLYVVIISHTIMPCRFVSRIQLITKPRVLDSVWLCRLLQQREALAVERKCAHDQLIAVLSQLMDHKSHIEERIKQLHTRMQQEVQALSQF
jgi:hypothetical protein